MFALHYEPSSVTIPISVGKILYVTFTLNKTPKEKLVTMAGTVRDEFGKPFEDTNVKMTLTRTTTWSGEPSLTVKTNQEGWFQFEPVTPQPYTISTFKTGYGSEEEKIMPATDFVLFKKKNVRFDYVYQPDGSRHFADEKLQTKTYEMEAGNKGFRFKDDKTANDGIPQDFSLIYRKGEYFFGNFFVNAENGLYDAGEVPFESVQEAKEGGAEIYRPVYNPATKTYKKPEQDNAATSATGTTTTYGTHWLLSRRGLLKVYSDRIVCGGNVIDHSEIEKAVLYTLPRQLLFFPCFLLVIETKIAVYQFGLNGWNSFWKGDYLFPSSGQKAQSVIPISVLLLELSSLFCVFIGSFVIFFRESDSLMNTFEILETVNVLPVGQRMFIAERIIHSVRNESQKISLKQAAELAVEDYHNDKELTAFTQLDGEDFYKTR